MGKFLPMERAKAKSLGEKSYFTSRPCKFGHIAKRLTSSGECFDCGSERFKKWNYKNRDAQSAKNKRYYAENAEKYREYAKKYRELNPNIGTTYRKTFRENNPDKIKEYTKNRQNARNLAMPVWLNKTQRNLIKSYYIAAKNIQKQSGIKMDVDHIIPLRGNNVCGLHVPWNLRVISASENRGKHKKVIDFPWVHSNNGVMISGNALPWNWRK
jgi:hypothetical protein